MLNFFKNKRKLKYIIVSILIISILLLSSIIFTIVSTQTKKNNNTVEIAKATTGYSATNPYTPIGFTHTEGSWDTGFVIKESSTGNEFVWVPVIGTNLSLARRDFTKSFSTMSQCSDTLDADFNASVSRYGGFYVGRYEAGINPNNADIPVCKKESTVWTNISRDNAKASAEKMYESNKEVISSLMNSYAYDTMLTWLKTKNYNVDDDSSSWGNYRNTSDGSIHVAGYKDKWKANNIYDIAGNVWEWTTENYFKDEKKNIIDAVVRGGDALSNGSVLPAGTRDHASPNSTFSYTGFRVLLYRDVNAITETKLQIATGTAQSAYIDNDKKLWMCGRNNFGALGTGNTEDKNKLTRVNSNTNFKEISLCKGTDSTNYGASLGIDTDGNLYSWGLNRFCTLGNGSSSTTTKKVTEPQKIASHIQKVSVGLSHCVALDTSGNLLTWGYAANGRLGNNTNSTSSSYYVKVPTSISSYVSTTFKEISAGHTHNVAIDKDGYLWSWGSPSNYKLGNENSSTTVIVPTKIPNMPTDVKFTKISAGYDHNMALDTEGNIWAWGSNSSGQLGTTNNFKVASLNNLNSKRVTSRAGITITPSPTFKVPTKIATGTKFIDISCGYQYSMFIDESGQLYGCGSNAYGQLGNRNKETQKTVIKILENTPVLKVSSNTRHTLVIDSKENVLVFGRNNYGQLGTSSTSNYELEPTTISIGS